MGFVLNHEKLVTFSRGAESNREVVLGMARLGITELVLPVTALSSWVSVSRPGGPARSRGVRLEHPGSLSRSPQLGALLPFLFWLGGFP